MDNEAEAAEDEAPSLESPGSSHPGVLSGNNANVTWKDLDAKFRRDLPDDAYVGRMVYRGMVMRACPAIRLLDGVETSDKERDKAEKILKGILGMKKGGAASTATATAGVVAAKEKEKAKAGSS